MKETLTQDVEKIIKEIITLTEKELPLTLIQKSQAPQTIYTKGIESRDNRYKVLVFQKKEPFTAPEEPCLVFYHPANQPMRGFQVVTVHQSDDQLEAKIPREIVQIQRRKHPRFVKTGKSSAFFTSKGGSSLFNVDVKDICIEGARLVGTFTDNIKSGDILAPLTLELRLVHGEFQEKIIIPEAKVQWVNDHTGGKRVMGIHFTLTDKELDRLDSYLNILSLQEQDL